MSGRAYERTLGWKTSLSLVAHVYQLTQDYPPEEKSGLAASMRKAITALPLKAAEAYEHQDYQLAVAAVTDAHSVMRDVLVLAQISQTLRILSSKQVGLLTRKIDNAAAALEAMVDDLYEEVEDLPQEAAA